MQANMPYMECLAMLVPSRRLNQWWVRKSRAIPHPQKGYTCCMSVSRQRYLNIHCKIFGVCFFQSVEQCGSLSTVILGIVVVAYFISFTLTFRLQRNRQPCEEHCIRFVLSMWYGFYRILVCPLSQSVCMVLSSCRILAQQTQELWRIYYNETCTPESCRCCFD